MDIEIASDERLFQCLRRTKGQEFTLQVAGGQEEPIRLSEWFLDHPPNTFDVADLEAIERLEEDAGLLLLSKPYTMIRRRR